MDQTIRAAHHVHFACRVLGAPASTPGEVQIGETLTQHLNRFRAGQVRTFLAALRTAHDHGHVRVAIGDDARVLDVTGA